MKRSCGTDFEVVCAAVEMSIKPLSLALQETVFGQPAQLSPYVEPHLISDLDSYVYYLQAFGRGHEGIQG
jgi:hypothetical protein